MSLRPAESRPGAEQRIESGKSAVYSLLDIFMHIFDVWCMIWRVDHESHKPVNASNGGCEKSRERTKRKRSSDIMHRKRRKTFNSIIKASARLELRWSRARCRLEPFSATISKHRIASFYSVNNFAKLFSFFFIRRDHKKIVKLNVD